MCIHIKNVNLSPFQGHHQNANCGSCKKLPDRYPIYLFSDSTKNSYLCRIFAPSEGRVRMYEFILESFSTIKMPQSGICPAPCVLRQCTSPLPPIHYICKVLHQSPLHENVVFSVFSRMGNAAYIIYIMWSSISGLNT